MNRNILYIAPLFLVAGCGKGGGYTPKEVVKVEPVKVTAGQEQELYPMAVGNQWVFTSESGGRKEEVTIKVADVQETGGAKVARLETSFGTGDVRNVQMRMDGTGVYQMTSPSGAAYTPSQPLIMFPLEKGTKEFEFTGPYPVEGEGPMKIAVKYVGVQEIDTDMGRLSAVAVESLTTWNTADGPGRSYAMTWWTPGIGFVRQRQEITIGNSSAIVLMKLKAYTAK